MTILYFLIPLALLLMAGALWALFWAIGTGQFDDLETQGWSVVLDEDRELLAPEKPAVHGCTESACEQNGATAQKKK